ncbi:MAG: hypothetical protein RML40_04750 [Bacteroidota bacterium]|nr:GPP34 family phosphoprotein [Candidatus Kapabacteria bacterium]MDW8219820.1 hypothetical protein [Bacteroidota bacterium]
MKYSLRRQPLCLYEQVYLVVVSPEETGRINLASYHVMPTAGRYAVASAVLMELLAGKWITRDINKHYIAVASSDHDPQDNLLCLALDRIRQAPTPCTIQAWGVTLAEDEDVGAFHLPLLDDAVMCSLEAKKIIWSKRPWTKLFIKQYYLLNRDVRYAIINNLERYIDGYAVKNSRTSMLLLHILHTQVFSLVLFLSVFRQTQRASMLLCVLPWYVIP